MKLLAVVIVLLAGCASSAPSGQGTAEPAPLTRQQAHLKCYQQMQAARAGALLTTPDWHQYRICMRNRGFDAAGSPDASQMAAAGSRVELRGDSLSL
jgi:hypothetical protein